MPDLYTNTPMTQRLEQVRSIYGNDPSAVQAGIANAMTQSTPFQDTLQSQGNAVNAMQQIGEYDKQLMAKYTAGNQQQQQQQQQSNAMLTAFGSAGATPQDTINKAQAPIPATTLSEPVSGFLSPFVASGLASGQQNANKAVFDMATQTRSALQSAIGTEAKAYADALKYAIEQEQIKAEQERLAKEAEDQDAKDKFAREFELVKMTGGTIYNPYDGKTYTIPAPKTAKEGTFDIDAALQTIKGKKITSSPNATPRTRPPLSSFELPEIVPSQDVNQSAQLIRPFIYNSGGGAG